MFEYFNGFWKWAEDNNERNTPNIVAMYFYLVHIDNDLGWLESFTITSTHAMNHLGIGAFKTYKTTLDKLEEYGLIEIVQRSKNQFTSTRVALVKMSKADAKQSRKQVQSIIENTSHIHKTIKDNKDLKEDSVEKATPELLVEKKKATKENHYDYKSRKYFNDEEANELIIAFFDQLVSMRKRPTELSVNMTMKRLKEATSRSQIIDSIERAIAGQYQAIHLDPVKATSKYNEPKSDNKQIKNLI